MKKVNKAVLSVGSFAEMKLLPGLLNVLHKNNLVKPTSIQWQAIPSLIETNFHHLIAAQTGTGKTLTYTLPLFHLLKQSEHLKGEILTTSKCPRAVVIVPNRELARQVESVLSLFKHEERLKTFAVFSGQKSSIESKELENGIDILVGTPERIDKLRLQKLLSFEKVEQIVIDESDTLLDSGFSRHIDLYCKELEKRSRFMFVSATFPPSLKKFVETRFSFEENKGNYMKKVVEEKTHLNLTHLKHDFIQLEEYDKNPLFFKVLEDVQAKLGAGSCIVFCNNIQSARAVEHFMNERGYPSVSLHGDVPNKLRVINVEKFSSQNVKFLVCTDLGSRGLDFPFVNFVVQFDFPKTESDYIHRAGRAGRAGRPGTVISFYRKNDFQMVNLLKKSFEKNKPLFISSSAFSLKNKEILIKANQSHKEKMRNILRKGKDN
jgi:ATP-dependent RNA helicase RhlE